MVAHTVHHPQQRLDFRPLPQGQGTLRPGPMGRIIVLLLSNPHRFNSVRPPTNWKQSKDHKHLASGIESLKCPIHPVNVRQMGSVVLAHLGIDQPVELVVHGEQEVLLGLIKGKIMHLIRIVLEVE